MSARVCGKRGRGAVLVRTWRLLVALENSRRRGLSVQEAAQLCGGDVCERTIRRDFQTLSEVFPIEPYQGKARYRLDWDAFQGGRRLLAGGAGTEVEA